MHVRSASGSLRIGPRKPLLLLPTPLLTGVRGWPLAGAVAGPPWDDDGRAGIEGTVASVGAPGTRGDKAGDASRASDYMDDADTKVNHLIEEVRHPLYYGLLRP